ncbi:MFS transporter [Pseudonocardia sp. GCM10023141]|uniref:MFS transporter n=1 Tax=Pseudonocardia sp. GCM10023141 TaxID=3252653 RepID=UPI003616F7BD
MAQLCRRISNLLQRRSRVMPERNIPGPNTRTTAVIAARLERLPLSSWHRKLLLIIGAGVFYEAFELFLGSVLTPILKVRWNLQPVEVGMLISSVFIGMALGAIGLGVLGDRIGRRRMFTLNLTVYLVAALVAATAQDIWFLVVCRIIAGAGVGAESVLIDSYLGELLPGHSRGRLLSRALAFGFLAVPVVSMAGALLTNTVFLFEGWRWLLIAAGSGVVLILWVRRNLPESPRWLASQGRLDEADTELRRIEDAVIAATGRELPPVSIEDGPARSIDVAARSRWSDVFAKNLRGRLAMMTSVQFLGTAGYYGFSSLIPVLLVAKGYTVIQSLGYAALISVGFPLGAYIASGVADRMERKTLIVLLLIMTAGLGVGFAYATETALVVSIGFLLTVTNQTLGVAIHVYMSELFPAHVRNRANGFGLGIGRIAAAFLPFLAVPLLAALGAPGVLIFCGAMLILAAGVVLGYGPRTTGRSLEETSENLDRARNERGRT